MSDELKEIKNQASGAIFLAALSIIIAFTSIVFSLNVYILFLQSTCN
jgi:hypothetical protein|tara:strand:- start:8943 stop:9083 length:141 start_codon:yes stop_codon:yes gene_type:complete